jgi:hypothetical protein
VDEDLELDLNFDGSSSEEVLEVEEGLSPLDEFRAAALSYFKDKYNYNIKFGGSKKKVESVKVKCNSPKKIALVMSEFDREAVQDLEGRGISFTYLTRTPEELYRKTLTTDREEILVVIVGRRLAGCIENVRDNYYEAVHTDFLDYRNLKVRGLTAKDCAFKEVEYINRFFLAHVLHLTIDWEPKESRNIKSEEYKLGLYPSGDIEEGLDLELDLGVEGLDFELDLG